MQTDANYTLCERRAHHSLPNARRRCSHQSYVLRLKSYRYGGGSDSPDTARAFLRARWSLAQSYPLFHWP